MTRYVTTTDQIADSLRELADRFQRALLTFPESSVSLDIQVCQHGGPEADRRSAVTALCSGILGQASGKNGSSLFGTPVGGVDVDHINVDIYTGVASARELELEAENERLRAQLAAASIPA
ncbi:hypothetical protein [Dactylosporangium sp. NPDC000521]|uniref:hypothetical protein n=1 Tax=Dactylosporangium sp. NPDC000521 TaxID=3363975 RepID=UPI003683DE3C